jgi:hypothetical protein
MLQTTSKLLGRVLAGMALLLHLPWVAADARPAPDTAPAPPTIQKVGPPAIRVARHVQGRSLGRNYPNALPTLLSALHERTSLRVDADPYLLRSFEDPTLFDYPFVYVNFADREDWELSDGERHNLKLYLERGGFIFVDAGINAEFLRGNVRHGQHHSFADWEASPPLKDAFASVFPGKKFQPLSRDDELFATFFSGLPDAAILPDTVREFVVNEKWPQGTYSAVALKVKGRIAVLATPIIAMGWGKNALGNWSTTISFRIRESSDGLSDYLRTAAYSGDRYEARREDGDIDVIYCQREALPAWVEEPGSRWRVFRYYRSREISDYAHVFYTQLGINIMIYALTR